jgi:DNA-binding response OmpR family regulator
MSRLPKVLLVEDDRSIASALAHALTNSYDIDIAATGRLALYKTDIEIYDIIILDLNLPDMSGTDICSLLRERGFSSPILILTGNDNVMTKIKLLDSGANDYLTKPFSLGELKARLRALARNQPGRPLPKRQLVAGELILDRQAYQVSYRGKSVSLRRKEFTILECLMENAGHIVTRQALVRHAWQGTDDLWTNTVDVHIKHIRDKIDRHIIQTAHGIGYRLTTGQAITAGKN